MAKKQAARKTDWATVIVTIAVIIGALVVLGWNGWVNAAYALSPNIATVNGEGVSRQYFDFQLVNMKLMYEAYGGEDVWYGEDGTSAATLDSVKSSVLNGLITSAMVRQEAARRGIRLVDSDYDEIGKEVAERMADFTDEEKKTYGINEKWVRQQALDDKYYSLLEDVVKLKDTQVSGADFDARFEEYMANYLTENEKTLDETEVYMLRFEGSEDAANQAKALLDAGTDFVQLIREQETFEEGMGYEEPQLIDAGSSQEIIDAAYELAVGETSDVIAVEDEDGSGTTWYYIIKIASKIPADKDVLRAEQLEAFKTQTRDEAFDGVLSSLSESADVWSNPVAYQFASIPGVAEIKPSPSPTPPLDVPEGAIPSESAVTDEPTEAAAAE
ncbi:MAG: SurA N-terminal domain-containing protein [Clostridiales bacterium]|jgi:hypothetical protein|nr:SurA N-terminal domain-containing protein [Clostridiales bacterium]